MSTPTDDSTMASTNTHLGPHRPRKRKTFLSLRAVAFAVILGTLIVFANTTFSLQSGFTYSMTLPSGLLAYGVFRTMRLKSRFTIEENALIIAIASSFGTMPLTIGTSGIVPGLEYLATPGQGGPYLFSTGKLVVWGLGLSLIGVIIAPPLRDYFVLREKLRFPAGTSAAILLSLLHKDGRVSRNMEKTDIVTLDKSGDDLDQIAASNTDSAMENDRDWRLNVTCIKWASAYAALYGFVTYFVPVFERIPLFGVYLDSQWGWSFHTSPSYLAMGMLVHTSTSLWMILGTVLGWGILGPISKTRGWANGPVRDWDTGLQGWVLWAALGAIAGDTLIYAIMIYGKALSSSLKQLIRILRTWQPMYYRARQNHSLQHDRPSTRASNSTNSTPDEAEPLIEATAPDVETSDAKISGISYRELIFWVALSAVVSLMVMSIIFRNLLSLSSTALGLALVLPLSLVCIRAMGEVGNAATDAVGRISQLIFVFIIPKTMPGAILTNMAVSSFSEAGGWQSAELMGELKLGFLTNVPATDMLHAQIIGSTLGAITGSLIYRLYTQVYTIPSQSFPAPHAHMVYSSATVLYAGGLPTGVAPFAICAMALSALGTTLRIFGNVKWTKYVPQSLAMALGIYIRPEFVLTRCAGGLVRWYVVDHMKWKELPLVSVSTGLILGETILSFVKFALSGLGVPHL